MASKAKSVAKSVSSHAPTQRSSSAKKRPIKQVEAPARDIEIEDAAPPAKRIRVPSRAAVEARESQASTSKTSTRRRAPRSRKAPSVVVQKQAKRAAASKPASRNSHVVGTRQASSSNNVQPASPNDVEDSGSLTTESDRVIEQPQVDASIDAVEEANEDDQVQQHLDDDENASQATDEADDDGDFDVDDAEFINDEDDITSWSASEDVDSDVGKGDGNPGSDDEQFEGDSLFEELAMQEDKVADAVEVSQSKASTSKVSHEVSTPKPRKNTKKVAAPPLTPTISVSKAVEASMTPAETPVSKAAAAAKARRARMGAVSVSDIIPSAAADVAPAFELPSISSIPEIHTPSIQAMIRSGSVASRRQVFNALEFVNDGVFINPSRAHPSLVRAVPTPKPYGEVPTEFDRKLVLANGPAATTGNAVFVSTVFVKDVKLKEAVEVKGMPTHLHRRLAGGMFEIETDLKSGFLGAAFPKFPSVIVSRDQECPLFTTRVKDKKTAQQASAIPSPSKGHLFMARSVSKPQASVASYSMFQDSLPWDAEVPIYDFTLRDKPFDFSPTDWATLSDCPQYILTHDWDEMGIDKEPVIAMIGYTINTYPSTWGPQLNQNIQFVAILARLGTPTSKSVATNPEWMAYIRDHERSGGDIDELVEEVVQRRLLKAKERSNSSPKKHAVHMVYVAL
ncbi:hypothetical protein EYR38_005036 [Pleurotus pulmonarius]|nr:hypothetical protein EYR38_005036 [Pleurotus pulmonarius]